MEDSAFVLHARAFTDSKVTIEWLTQNNGRVTTVARAPSKRSRSVFQLFQQHLIYYFGSGELKTLSKSEVSAGVVMPTDGIKYGMYLNELLLRILAKEDPHPVIFADYKTTLVLLQTVPLELEFVEKVLRNFELNCLQELGYQIDFNIDAKGQPIKSQCNYTYASDSGFEYTEIKNAKQTITGGEIAAVARRDLSKKNVLRAAKIICRSALAPLLGSKPLKSRELFK